VAVLRLKNYSVNIQFSKKGFDNYVPLELSMLKDDDINVVVFFGTWCHDSKRELPKALKIFNKIGMNDENIELIAVGLDKKEPLGRAAKLNLMYTPTLIFFRGSKEIGRIIEKPVLSLEKDIELIISSI
jgi:thiol-disulfide isomerase/thioredoxin